MRVIGGFGPTGDSDVPTGDSHDYATWDAAYVLGSLSSADRREFEAHLSVCPICTPVRRRAQRHTGVAVETRPRHRRRDGCRPPQRGA